MNCKKCAAAAKACAVKKAEAQKANNADGGDAVLVVEEDAVTITPIPDNAAPQAPEKAPAAK